MSFNTLLFGLAAAGLVKQSVAGYSLQDNYAPSNFFSEFSFFTDSDPTHGYVDYLSQSAAQSAGLISETSSSVRMAADSKNVASGSGRQSVRITSTKTYDDGLFIVDLAHMPVGCGTWPAFWLVGPNWPNDGEIDIIEGVNLGTTNQATLHTGPGCSISKSADMTGTFGTQQTCTSSNGNNNGCAILETSSSSYGSGFNSAGGGVYATEVTSSGINIWFWSRGSVPSDVSGGSPDPSSWGTPFAAFEGCSIPSHFKSMSIVFDLTFCGDWAGNVWSSSSCASKASTCNAFVQNNPSAFDEAYWTVNSLKVYSGSSSGVSNNNSSAPTGGSHSSAGSGSHSTAGSGSHSSAGSGSHSSFGGNGGSVQTASASHNRGQSSGGKAEPTATNGGISVGASVPAVTGISPTSANGGRGRQTATQAVTTAAPQHHWPSGSAPQNWEWNTMTAGEYLDSSWFDPAGSQQEKAKRHVHEHARRAEAGHA